MLATFFVHNYRQVRLRTIELAYPSDGNAPNRLDGARLFIAGTYAAANATTDGIRHAWVAVLDRRTPPKPLIQAVAESRSSRLEKPARHPAQPPRVELLLAQSGTGQGQTCRTSPSR